MQPEYVFESISNTFTNKGNVCDDARNPSYVHVKYLIDFGYKTVGSVKNEEASMVSSAVHQFRIHFRNTKRQFLLYVTDIS